MHEAKTYRRYATDCTRMAQKLNAEDKEVLMKIAEAWELRAQEAECRQQKTDGNKS